MPDSCRASVTSRRLAIPNAGPQPQCYSRTVVTHSPPGINSPAALRFSNCSISFNSSSLKGGTIDLRSSGTISIFPSKSSNSDKLFKLFISGGDEAEKDAVPANKPVAASNPRITPSYFIVLKKGKLFPIFPSITKTQTGESAAANSPLLG